MIKYAAILFIPFFLSACDNGDSRTFPGYVEGEYVYIAPARAGRLENLAVARGTRVKEGEALFKLEADTERHSLQEAEQAALEARASLEDMETGKRPEEVAMAQAQLSQARAEAANAMTTLKRNETLAKQGGVSRRELDDSRANARTTAARVAELENQVKVYNLPERQKRIDAQRAAVKAAEARVAQARWDLNQKEMSAPAAGLISDTLYYKGEWVPAANPVIQLLPPDHIKIRFFIPERLLGQIKIGERINCTLDGVKEAFSATVTYISPDAEYTPPIIYSNETRSKLVFMVEATPDESIRPSLHPGQPLSINLI